MRRWGADRSDISVAGTGGGLHAVLSLPPGAGKAALLDARADRQVAVGYEGRPAHHDVSEELPGLAGASPLHR